MSKINQLKVIGYIDQYYLVKVGFGKWRVFDRIQKLLEVNSNKVNQSECNRIMTGEIQNECKKTS